MRVLLRIMSKERVVYDARFQTGSPGLSSSTSRRCPSMVRARSSAAFSTAQILPAGSSEIPTSLRSPYPINCPPDLQSRVNPGSISCKAKYTLVVLPVGSNSTHVKDLYSRSPITRIERLEIDRIVILLQCSLTDDEVLGTSPRYPDCELRLGSRNVGVERRVPVLVTRPESCILPHCQL
jgi:hypothetical protein